MLFQSTSTCPHRFLHLRHLLLSPHSRPASTSSKFPFPSARNATPHQIFHLPKGASQEQIKARYYDLVKLYHPDSAPARALSSDQRTLRFQAITKAYEILRGRVPDPSPNARQSSDDVMRAELRRRRPAQQARTHWQGASARNAHQRTNTGATGYADSVWGEDDGDGAFVRARASELGQTQRAMRWDEALRYASFAVIAVVSLAAIGFHSYHTRVEHHTRTAAANLAQARAEAQEFGMERRRRIRERVVEAKMLETARAEDTRRIEELQPVGRQDHPSVDERS